MSEPQVDLSYQAKIGEDFTLPQMGGGTGRTDGGAQFVVVPVQNESGGSLAIGTVVRRDNVYPTGPALLVTPVTAATQIPVGVVVGAAIADGSPGYIAVHGSPALVLTEGTVSDGDVLVASATSGRAKTAAANALSEIGFAIALNDASGTSQVWATLVGPFTTGLSYSIFPGEVSLLVGNGTDVITTGIKADLRWPFSGTLTRWTLLADIAGAIVFDIWKDTFANFPPTVADTITASAKPTLTASDDEAESTTLTGWTTAFNEGDIFRFNVDSVTTIRRVTLGLKYLRTGT
jgi:hypothetical protein